MRFYTIDFDKYSYTKFIALVPIFYMHNFSFQVTKIKRKMIKNSTFLGYCYYSNSACNPILYNILSEKYRIAFCRTIFGERIAMKIFNIKNRNLMMHSCMSGSYFPNRPPSGRSRSSNHLLKPSGKTSPTRSPSRAASITVIKKNTNGDLCGKLTPIRHFSDESVYHTETLGTPLLSIPRNDFCIDRDAV